MSKAVAMHCVIKSSVSDESFDLCGLNLVPIFPICSVVGAIDHDGDGGHGRLTLIANEVAQLEKYRTDPARDASELAELNALTNFDTCLQVSVKSPHSS